jgi:hypothetical protein
MKWFACVALICASCLQAQTAAPWKALSFLEGTWEAKTQGGAAGAAAAGTYTFAKELSGHVLSRRSNYADCQGPDSFNCEHRDLLYVYEGAPGKPLKAIYFDSEGHVIHYDVSTPAPASAVFLSDASQPGPKFRLMYELKGAVMSGKFEMQMPGQAEWKAYLEWSGAKK